MSSLFDSITINCTCSRCANNGACDQRESQQDVRIKSDGLDIRGMQNAQQKRSRHFGGRKRRVRGRNTRCERCLSVFTTDARTNAGAAMRMNSCRSACSTAMSTDGSANGARTGLPHCANPESQVGPTDEGREGGRGVSSLICSGLRPHRWLELS